MCRSCRTPWQYPAFMQRSHSGVCSVSRSTSASHRIRSFEHEVVPNCCNTVASEIYTRRFNACSSHVRGGRRVRRTSAQRCNRFAVPRLAPSHAAGHSLHSLANMPPQSAPSEPLAAATPTALPSAPQDAVSVAESQQTSVPVHANQDGLHRLRVAWWNVKHLHSLWSQSDFWELVNKLDVIFLVETHHTLPSQLRWHVYGQERPEKETTGGVFALAKTPGEAVVQTSCYPSSDRIWLQLQGPPDQSPGWEDVTYHVLVIFVFAVCRASRVVTSLTSCDSKSI